MQEMLREVLLRGGARGGGVEGGAVDAHERLQPRLQLRRWQLRGMARRLRRPLHPEDVVAGEVGEDEVEVADVAPRRLLLLLLPPAPLQLRRRWR